VPGVFWGNAGQMEDRPRLAISWNGLPQYAARLIRAAIERWGAPVDVIGSRPTVPVAGMEEALGQTMKIGQPDGVIWASTLPTSSSSPAGAIPRGTRSGAR
jgi:hypothetical protein